MRLPFDTGAGRAELTRAAATPLVMDETAANMLAANPASGGDVGTERAEPFQGRLCRHLHIHAYVPTATAQNFAASVQPTNGGLPLILNRVDLEFLGELANGNTSTGRGGVGT